MTVLLNGEEKAFDGPATVADLVERLGCGRLGVAVAVNDEIVPRSAWADRHLEAGDRVEVLRAVQGG